MALALGVLALPGHAPERVGALEQTPASPLPGLPEAKASATPRALPVDTREGAIPGDNGGFTSAEMALVTQERHAFRAIARYEWRTAQGPADRQRALAWALMDMLLWEEGDLDPAFASETSEMSAAVALEHPRWHAWAMLAGCVDAPRADFGCGAPEAWRGRVAAEP